MAAVANGWPLSVRIARGSPSSRKVRSKIGVASSHLVERNPSQVSRLRDARSATVSG
jgi:hypothetical protein